VNELDIDVQAANHSAAACRIDIIAVHLIQYTVANATIRRSNAY